MDYISHGSFSNPRGRGLCAPQSGPSGFGRQAKSPTKSARCAGPWRPQFPHEVVSAVSSPAPAMAGTSAMVSSMAPLVTRPSCAITQHTKTRRTMMRRVRRTVAGALCARCEKGLCDEALAFHLQSMAVPLKESMAVPPKESKRTASLSSREHSRRKVAKAFCFFAFATKVPMSAHNDPASSIQESCRGLAAILDSAAAAARGHDGIIRADCDAVCSPRPSPAPARNVLQARQRVAESCCRRSTALRKSSRGSSTSTMSWTTKSTRYGPLSSSPSARRPRGLNLLVCFVVTIASGGLVLGVARQSGGAGAFRFA